MLGSIGSPSVASRSTVTRGGVSRTEAAPGEVRLPALYTYGVPMIGGAAVRRGVTCTARSSKLATSASTPDVAGTPRTMLMPISDGASSTCRARTKTPKAADALRVEAPGAASPSTHTTGRSGGAAPSNSTWSGNNLASRALSNAVGVGVSVIERRPSEA